MHPPRWILICCLLSFATLYFAAPAGAHLYHFATSDEPRDPGPNIQLYKAPGTDFGGDFRRARMEWNRAGPPASVKFRMVYQLEQAEVYVYAATGPCRGEHHNVPGAIDLLMISSECDGDLRRAVALHELGHALDQDHHGCWDKSSVMNQCARVSTLTLHDKVSKQQLIW